MGYFWLNSVVLVKFGFFHFTVNLVWFFGYFRVFLVFNFFSFEIRKPYRIEPKTKLFFKILELKTVIGPKTKYFDSVWFGSAWTKTAWIIISYKQALETNKITYITSYSLSSSTHAFNSFLKTLIKTNIIILQITSLDKPSTTTNQSFQISYNLNNKE